MAEDWEPWLERWTRQGLLSPESAASIRAFESSQIREHRLRWPVLLALGCGVAALSAGVLLFVSAHWDDLSPAARMIVVLAMLMLFHAGGAFFHRRFHALAISLHAVGTAVLGAAIALTGQIFNLEEHWPAAILLWALGAMLGWWILEHWTQAIFVAILAPAWLAFEWWYFAGENEAAAAPALVFVFLIATVYLGGRPMEGVSPLRQALTWIGATTILPLGIALSFSSRPHSILNPWAAGAAWILAVFLPLAAAFFLRVSLAWTVAATLWAIGIALVVHGGIAGYAWDAIGAIGLAIWGMREGRSERVNLGIAGFALTVAIFYFSSVMDKLGRSASLVGLGVLLLGGGWALERLRRVMVERTRTATS
jgi:uncharacterized membrane protein